MATNNPINRILAVCVGMMALLLGGCATADVSVKSGFDFGQVKNVGVLDFNTPRGKKAEAFGQMAADIFSKELLDVGFSVIERTEIEKIMKELKLGQSGAIDPSMAKEVGRVAGVDSVVFGSISPTLMDRGDGVSAPMVRGRGRRARRARALQRARQKSQIRWDVTDINVTAKMVRVETGEILWVGTANKDSNDVQTSIKSAIKLIGKKLKSKI